MEHKVKVWEKQNETEWTRKKTTYTEDVLCSFRMCHVVIWWWMRWTEATVLAFVWVLSGCMKTFEKDILRLSKGWPQWKSKRKKDNERKHPFNCHTATLPPPIRSPLLLRLLTLFPSHSLTKINNFTLWKTHRPWGNRVTPRQQTTQRHIGYDTEDHLTVSKHIAYCTTHIKARAYSHGAHWHGNSLICWNMSVCN